MSLYGVIKWIDKKTSGRAYKPMEYSVIDAFFYLTVGLSVVGVCIVFDWLDNIKIK